MSFAKLRYTAVYALIGVALIVTGAIAYQKLYITHFSQAALEAKYLAAANADPVTISAGELTSDAQGGVSSYEGSPDESQTAARESGTNVDDTYPDSDPAENGSWYGEMSAPPEQPGADDRSGTGQGGDSTVTPTPGITPPRSPSGLWLTSPSASQIDVKWNAMSGATQYHVTYSASAQFSPSSQITSGTAKASLTGLSASTTYYIKVQSINSAGQSAYSAVVFMSTQKYVPPAPQIPTKVAANSPTPNGFTISWQAASNATQYIVRVAQNAHFNSKVKEYAPTKSLQYTVADLYKNTTYYIQVRASNNGTLSGWSNTVGFGTKYEYPSTLSLNAVSATQINATWSSVSGATTYTLRYAASAAMTSAKTITTSNTKASITGLAPNTTYYVQVNAGAAPRTSDWQKVGTSKTKMRFDVRVASFNILSQYLDERQPKGEKWSDRKALVAKTILNNGLEIVGAQESTAIQRSDLLKLLPEYAATKSYDGAKLGEDIIYYKKNVVSVAEQGSFIISKSWKKKKETDHQSFNRYGVWALFKHNATGKYFYVFNTHLQVDREEDSRFLEANKSGAVELVKGIASINKKKRPVFITGDFNSVTTAAGHPYATITGAGYAASISKTPKNQQMNMQYNSYNGFQPPKTGGYQIDRVYISSSIVPQNVKLITDTFNGKYASDHFSVYTTGRLEL